MKSEKYLKFVRSLPCCHCKKPAEPHHIIGICYMGVMGSKASDLHTMPLCRDCHEEVHRDPASWPQTRWMMDTQLKAVKEGILKI